MQRFAEDFASTLSPNTVLALHGDLGAGKTVFVKGIARFLGCPEEMVRSPTFLYLHPYPTQIPLFHFDLYRLESAEDFMRRGFDEYFNKGGISAIEWPEKIISLLPIHMSLYFSYLSETSRKLVIA